jgi:hypothetical protein
MSTHSWDEDSPDRRFQIMGWSDSCGAGGYAVSYPEELEDGVENPLFETAMPNGEEWTDFNNLWDAQEFVEDMVKCLDGGGMTDWLQKELDQAKADIKRLQARSKELEEQLAKESRRGFRQDESIAVERIIENDCGSIDCWPE